MTDNLRPNAKMSTLRARQSRTIAASDALVWWCCLGLAVAILGAIGFYWTDRPDDSPWLETWNETAQMLKPFWWVGLVFFALRIVYYVHVIKSARLDDHRTGKTL